MGRGNHTAIKEDGHCPAFTIWPTDFWRSDLGIEPSTRWPAVFW